MYEIFKKFKQRKKQKSPRVRLLSQKANRLVLIGCALFGLSLIGAIRANVMAGNVIRLSQQLETINKDVKNKRKRECMIRRHSLLCRKKNEYINFNGKATDEEKKHVMRN